MRHARHFVVMTAIATGSVARAEGLEKVQAPELVWSLAAVVGILAFLACRRWPRASVGVVPVLAFAGWCVAYGDPEILAAYRSEIGSTNFWIHRFYLIASGAVMPMAALAGALLGWFRERRNAS
jgi:hypothetical protein